MNENNKTTQHDPYGEGVRKTERGRRAKTWFLLPFFLVEPRSFSPHSRALCTEILWAPGIKPGLAELSLKASNHLSRRSAGDEVEDHRGIAKDPGASL
jgi:hypothetical protein